MANSREAETHDSKGFPASFTASRQTSREAEKLPNSGSILLHGGSSDAREDSGELSTGGDARKRGEL